MRKTISMFRVKNSLKEIASKSDRFSIFQRKDAFVQSFFVVSSNWQQELSQKRVIDVVAEIKFLGEKEPFVEVFDSSAEKFDFALSQLVVSDWASTANSF